MADMSPRMAVFAALLVITATAPVAAKSARTSFDGYWSILIVTDAGSCDPAYRFGLRIAGGQLFYNGVSGVELSGRVDVRGRVRVTLRQGDSAAQGSGQLSESSGSGGWQGASPTARCSGHWLAARGE
jgi:hypothetical protein